VIFATRSDFPAAAGEVYALLRQCRKGGTDVAIEPVTELESGGRVACAARPGGAPVRPPSCCTAAVSIISLPGQ
jgi:hypothetical protein